MNELGRTPPAEVRRTLAAEVGFGCPVEGCGSAYLSWHHFDPPWGEQQHHNPEGMVALCLHHHKAADTGAYTTEQLRRLKENPFLRAAGKQVEGRFEWRRQQLIVLAGGILAVGSRAILRFGETDAIWLSEDDDGHVLLNVIAWDSEGNPLFVLRDNAWEIVRDVARVECPPAGKSLRVSQPDEGIDLSLKFFEIDEERLLELLYKRALSSAKASDKNRLAFVEEARARGASEEFLEALRGGSHRQAPEEAARVEAVAQTEAIKGFAGDGPFAICELEASFPNPLPVKITPAAVILPGNNTVSAAMFGVAVAVQVG